MWKATQPQEYFTDDWHDPRAMYEKAEREVSDEEFKQSYIIGVRSRSCTSSGSARSSSSAPRSSAFRTAPGADPLGALAAYAEHVLPALRAV